MAKCVFCKIVKKELPCYVVFENELIMSFLVRKPTANGHLVVIPKQHYENIFDTPDNILGEINKVCKQMSFLLKEKLGATGVNILNASGKDAQQSVFHIHYHVVPRSKDDGLDLWFHEESNNSDELKNVQDRLVS